MTFDEQLALLKPHARFRRALFIDNEVRSFEITFVEGEFCLYRLHDYGHRPLGRFPNFKAAYALTL